MITEQGEPPASTADRSDLIDESIASYARLAPPRHARGISPRGAVLGGGDATKAPRRLSAGQLEPIEGASSGVSWDDPEEL
ncbi:hypothetical protein L1785_13035 [Antribacter sp. KLBMP9083]|uniref:Uncharacterized protein n=1 Tax=Antribacter soli TaxID=2910976 RepID=A0AA41QEY9_9MICO|nr:hypothetical protein [Antribacter soli]MCF4121901.1 hypothetical protein [Antribacter soli]